MIDTDKYEGHTEGEWRVDDEMGLVIKYGERPHDFVDMENKANAQLMADAPLLLAEVKRLRKALLLIADTANGRPFISGHIDSFVGEVLKELVE